MYYCKNILPEAYSAAAIPLTIKATKHNKRENNSNCTTFQPNAVTHTQLFRITSMRIQPKWCQIIQKLSRLNHTEEKWHLYGIFEQLWRQTTHRHSLSYYRYYIWSVITLGLV